MESSTPGSTSTELSQDDSVVQKPRTGKYWYKITYEECPMCGNGRTWRERQYSPKPENPKERIFWESIYDYCLEWESLRD